MTQIGFGLESAHEALDQFLNDTSPDGDRTRRWIGSADGETIAHIVPADDYDRLVNGYQQWEASQEREPDHDLPAGYRPFIHSPLASMDRLLPIEPLLDPICWGIHKKKFAELEDDGRDQWHVRAVAITVALRVTLDPDGQGAVPVLAVTANDAGEPGAPLRWQIAFVTPVAGLYVRATGGFFGDEWSVVTGSGWRVASCWYSREGATRAAVALGTALPNCDWMRLTPEGFTPAAKKVIGEVIARHRFSDEPDEGKPEPEPLTDVIPADET